MRLVANKLFAEDHLVPDIERFARETLFSFVESTVLLTFLKWLLVLMVPLFQAHDEKNKKCPEEEAKETEEDGKEQDREIALYFALCLKKVRTIGLMASISSELS